MAMSQEEREKRLNIIHMMESRNRFFTSYAAQPSYIPVNEEADPRMRDLKDIEKFLDGKKVPYSESVSLPLRENYALSIDLMFLSTKSVKVDPGNNLLRVLVDIDDYYGLRISDQGNYSCDLKTFIGLPRKVDSPDFKSVDEIISVCNASEIYNLYKPRALSMIQSRMPTAYSMFTGGRLEQIQVRKGDYYWQRGVSTLAVTFDKRMNKFLYLYHPEFILSCAFDEWFLNRRKYDSLESCYVYLLSFMISHEMMHLLHHNTTTSIDMGESKLDVSDLDKNDITRIAEESRIHELQNIQQDNFINSQLSLVFQGVDGLRDSGMAPMPRMGIGSVMTFRAEHNKGFKKFKTFKDLGTKIAEVISDTLRNPDLMNSIHIRGSKNLSDLEGADVFISLYVNPNASDLRKSSGIFQKFTNELMKVITDGRMFGEYTKLSDAEKEQDKPIIPNGSLVQVKGSNAICSVISYDEESKTYEIGYTEMSVTKQPAGDTQVLCIPSYTPTGEVFGNRRRRDIRPFDPSKNIWYEDTEPREKKTQLSGQDLMQADQSSSNKGLNSVEKFASYGSDDNGISTEKMLDSLYNSVMDENPPAGWGKDILNKCSGVSEDECKNILGDKIYNALQDVLKTLEEVIGNPLKQDNPSAEQSQPQQVPIFHIGDVVWVRRKRKFGRIVSINNGQFELEEVEEVGVKILDDTQKGISEAASRVVLKERVFKSTGRMLGTFPALDLETFDMEYTESDVKKQQDDQNSSGKSSSVPQPKDDNPIKPEEEEKPKSSDNGSSGGSDGEEGEPEEPDDWDINGRDLDDDDPPPASSDSDDSPGGGAVSDNSSGDSDQDDSGEDDSSGDRSENTSKPDSSGSTDDSENPGDEPKIGDPKTGEDGSEKQDNLDDNLNRDIPGSSSDGSETDDPIDPEEEKPKSSDNGSSGGSDGEEGEPEEPDDFGESDLGSDSDSDKSQSGSKQKQRQGSNLDGSDKHGGGEPEDTDYDDPDWDSEDEDGFSSSDLEKALQEIDESESEVSKNRRQGEESFEKKEAEKKEQENPNDDAHKATPDQVAAAKDMLNKAIKEARERERSNPEDILSRVQFDENDILDAMGAKSLSSNFVPKMAGDWKAQLTRILDIALGFDMITNPNLVNKKLEDAPPGREDDIPTIDNIAILLDCSGSMGAKEFAKVIAHLDTMFMVRKMDKTNFHIIDWGTTSVKSIADTYIKVKGRRFKQEIMKHKEHGWGTDLVPGLLVASQKLRKPDAIIIMTDADIYDSNHMGRTAEGKIAEAFVKKFKKRIIWVLTGSTYRSRVKEFDPTADADKRIVIFRK